MNFEFLIYSLIDFNLKNKTPDIRYLKEMEKVVYDKEWFKTADLNLELYYIYRGLKEKNGLRYDITIIPARMLGKEFVKTKGHYHFENYEELYTVLEGKAIFLMQKRNKNGQIIDVYTVEAQTGESIIIPAGYGHITINPSLNEKLKIANWVSKNCRSNYIPFEEKGGACYFYTENGWLKNKNYKNTPPLRTEKPLKSLPENLDFLSQKK